MGKGAMMAIPARVMAVMRPAVVKCSRPALPKINVQRIVVQVRENAKHAHRAISARAASAIPMGHADHHQTYSLLVHMVVATVCSLLPKNATMPILVTVMAATLPVYSSAASVVMASCSVLSENVVSRDSTILLCPISAILRHANF